MKKEKQLSDAKSESCFFSYFLLYKYTKTD